MIRRYESLELFYAGDERRVRSVEVDFGVWWRSSLGEWPTWRISWVEDTGELIAVKLEVGPMQPRQGGPVHVLATALVELEDAQELLDGWEDVCGGSGSLDWARERCGARSEAAGF